MKNVLKIVFLGLMGFALITFLTAEKPKEIVKKDNLSNTITYDALPVNYELVGKEKMVSKENLFKKAEKTLLIVGNHDSLAVVKELTKYYKVQLPYVMVANISAAPWFVKKMFIPEKLEELNKGTNIPMIYDFDGHMVNSLNITDNSKIRYFAYLISKSGAISKIYEGSVKEGALDGSMSEEEKKKVLEPLSKLIK